MFLFWKIQTQDHQINLLDKTLNTLQRQLDQTRTDYEEKLRQVESAVVEQTSINESTQNQAKEVRNEVARLRALLEAEEKRLNLNWSSEFCRGDTAMVDKTVSDDNESGVDRALKNPRKPMTEGINELEFQCPDSKE